LLTFNRGLASRLIVNINDCVLVVIVLLKPVVRAERSDRQHPVDIVTLLSEDIDIVTLLSKDTYPQSDSMGHHGALNNKKYIRMKKKFRTMLLRTYGT
jgi:hypothetical protein